MPVTIRKHTKHKKTQAREVTAPRRSSQCAMSTTRVDEKGRVTLPAPLRALLGVEPGTMFAIRSEAGGFYLAKVENPFDALAAEAIAEHRASRTRNLREFARDRNITVDSE